MRRSMKFSSNMTKILDDKSPHCIPFILDRIAVHRQAYLAIGETPAPFFIGLNGVQGAGKTTLVNSLSQILSSSPHSLATVVLSIDDLYLPHDRQVALAKTHASNPLVQHRGQPSTHDVALGDSVFHALAHREPDIRIPSYDKSAFSGQGDQRPEAEWQVVNGEGSPAVDVVVFEGWCVGFRPLSDGELERKWKGAQQEYKDRREGYHGQLGLLKMEDVRFVNQELSKYDVLTDHLGAFIHIDAEETQFVYEWRQEQEAVLRAEKGTGMTVEQVTNFVNGYYPAYELYTDVLRRGIFENEKGKQMRLIVDRNRQVKEVIHI